MMLTYYIWSDLMYNEEETDEIDLVVMEQFVTVKSEITTVSLMLGG